MLFLSKLIRIYTVFHSASEYMQWTPQSDCSLKRHNKARGYKTFWCSTHFVFLSDLVFFMLINVKMSTFVDILTFMSMTKFHNQFSWACLFFITSGKVVFIAQTSIDLLPCDISNWSSTTLVQIRACRIWQALSMLINLQFTISTHIYSFTMIYIKEIHTCKHTHRSSKHNQ